MPIIYIDNKPYEVGKDKNLLEACLSLGFNLPYFCWHPALGSVGACRQCAIKLFKDGNDSKGKLVMSCMEPVSENKRISIDDPEAKEFRENVIEWLMINHPHDCAVCDEGGSCHLQDMTVMAGHTYRKYKFKKRTYRNQYLGPFINHEMNRCIQCYRCVRFYKDYAGGKDLDVFAANNHLYFGRQSDGVLESEFSGNLVEVCPTGVFTDKTLKEHYTRKWDLSMAPSICHHCSLGCNITVGERYGSIRSVTNRYNGEINGYFLCDRGRFGYESVNSSKRIRKAIIPGNEKNMPGETDHHTALSAVGDLIKKSNKLIGIGSPRASLESNFALRMLVGDENFYSGVAAYEHFLIKAIIEILKQGGLKIPSLSEIEKADAVLILGEDVTNTAPMLALALRQSVRMQPSLEAAEMKIPAWQDDAVREVVQDNTGPLFIASSYSTRLDDIATRTYLGYSDDVARFGFAVSHYINSKAPEVKGLTNEEQELAREVATTLKNAKNPLIISGTGAGRKAVLKAAGNVVKALSMEGKTPGAYMCIPECNSMGMAMMGSKSVEQAFIDVKSNKADALIVLENDLYRRASEKDVDEFLSGFKNIIALDHYTHRTTEKAGYILPAGSFAESDGTLISSEGRAQRFFEVYYPGEEITQSWNWLLNLMKAAGNEKANSLNTVDDFTALLEKTLSQFKGIVGAAPGHEFRIKGQKIPRKTQRYSGLTANLANISVSEPMPPDDPDSPFSFSSEGYRGVLPSSAIPFFWAPGWNSVQSVNKYQEEVGGPLDGGDPGIRILKNGQQTEAAFSADIPDAFHMYSSKWFIVPMHHIFGSEELSMLAPAIAERAPEPYLALNAQDAEKLSAPEGSFMQINIDGVIQNKLKLIINNGIKPGTVGIPLGLPGMKWISLPGWGGGEP